MGLYILLLVLCCVLYLSSISTVSTEQAPIGSQKYFSQYKKGTIFVSLLCFIIIAFRSKDVGIDSLSYLEHLYESTFDSVKNYADVFDIQHTEIGFSFITFVINSLGFKQGLFIFEAFSIIIPLFLFIKRNSANPYFSLLLFICLDYFGFALTGLRQTIAIGAILMALNSLNCDNYKKAIVFVLLAISIHTSSLIAIPLLFIKRIPLNKTMFVIAIILAAIVNSLKVLLMSFMQEFNLHEGSVGNVETGGSSYYYFLLTIVFLIFLQKWKDNFKDSGQDYLYWMMLASVIMYPALQFNPTMFRLHYYYSISIIVVLPYLFLKMGNFGKVLSLAYLSIAIYYFLNYPLSVMGIVPYQFFFE